MASTLTFHSLWVFASSSFLRRKNGSQLRGCFFVFAFLKSYFCSSETWLFIFEWQSFSSFDGRQKNLTPKYLLCERCKAMLDFSQRKKCNSIWDEFRRKTPRGNYEHEIFVHLKLDAFDLPYKIHYQDSIFADHFRSINCDSEWTHALTAPSYDISARGSRITSCLTSPNEFR